MGARLFTTISQPGTGYLIRFLPFFPHIGASVPCYIAVGVFADARSIKGRFLMSYKVTNYFCNQIIKEYTPIIIMVNPKLRFDRKRQSFKCQHDLSLNFKTHVFQFIVTERAKSNTLGRRARFQTPPRREETVLNYFMFLAKGHRLACMV